MLPLIILWILLGKDLPVPIADVQPLEFEELVARGYGFSVVVLDEDGFATAWEPVRPDEAPIWRPEEPMDRVSCVLKVVQVGPVRAFRCYKLWGCDDECRTTLVEVLPGATVWRCLCR